MLISHTPYCSYHIVAKPLWFPTARIELSLTETYLAFVALFRSLLPYVGFITYFGCHRLITALITLADHRLILAIILGFITSLLVDTYTAHIALFRLSWLHFDKLSRYLGHYHYLHYHEWSFLLDSIVWFLYLILESGSLLSLCMQFGILIASVFLEYSYLPLTYMVGTW